MDPTSNDSDWDLLGIAPTDDLKEIRRAYARRLKTIDVDADPQAFIALREALERACGYRQGPAGAHPPTTSDSHKPSDAPSPDSEIEAPKVTEDPAWLSDLRTLEALVSGDAPRESIFDEVEARFTRILADPAMELIGHAERVEGWAAQTILAYMPRTDAMLVPAINHFGWFDRIDYAACPMIIRAAVDRYAGCRFMDRVRAKKGPTRNVYERLCDPAFRPDARYARQVATLLSAIRARYPLAIHDFAPEAVRAWDAWLADWEPEPEVAGTGIAVWLGSGCLRWPTLFTLALLALAAFGVSVSDPGNPVFGVLLGAIMVILPIWLVVRMYRRERGL